MKKMLQNFGNTVFWQCYL